VSGAGNGVPGETVQSSVSTDAARICEQRGQQVAMLIQSAVGRLDCRSDGDCMVASTSTACFKGCGVIVNAQGAAAVDAVLVDAAKICSADGLPCSAAIPPCIYKASACIDGMCQAAAPSMTRGD
jgi:hypothetical protein